jgi:hypothetical protein
MLFVPLRAELHGGPKHEGSDVGLISKRPFTLGSCSAQQRVHPPSFCQQPHGGDTSASHMRQAHMYRELEAFVRESSLAWGS